MLTVAQTLDIPLHDDPLVLASAIAKTIKAKLSKDVLLPKEDKSPSPQPQQQPQQLTLGGRYDCIQSNPHTFRIRSSAHSEMRARTHTHRSLGLSKQIFTGKR